MGRAIGEQIISFGEIPQPHEVITIVYSSIRVESRLLYKELVPIDPIREAIIRLQQEAERQEADGVKNISIQMVVVHTETGEEVVDYYASGTLFRFQ